MGEFENTLFVVTADHGYAFPRAKTQLYDSGTQVPLVVQWPAKFDGGQEETNFVSLTDLAPTFLEAAGMDVPQQMTGQSLMPVLTTNSSSQNLSSRNEVFFGRERHVPCQEAPAGGQYCDGYPMRAIRTENYLYVHNFTPDGWPSGTPDYREACFDRSWLGDCDPGPTKNLMYANRDEKGMRELYDLSFSKRPTEELYDLRSDPYQTRLGKIV